MGLEHGSMGGTDGSTPGGVDAAALAREAVALLGGGSGGSFGGLGALRQAFEDAGLGAAFASWVGTGSNLPVTAAELERALGAEAIGRIARSARAEPARVAAALAEILPRVVDLLTPAGALPGGADQSAALARRQAGRP